MVLLKRRYTRQVGNGAIPIRIIVLFLPRPGKKCNWPDRNLSRARRGSQGGRDAGDERIKEKKARVRTGDRLVITMIRATNGPRKIEESEQESCLGSSSKWRMGAGHVERNRYRSSPRSAGSNSSFQWKWILRTGFWDFEAD